LRGESIGAKRGRSDPPGSETTVAEQDAEGEDDELLFEGRVRASWLLIWCHERCYKPERSALRAHLTEVAMSLSAGILCVKKAVKYEAWMKRTNNKFHVLITDWREAKPCVHAVEESQQEDSWPEMIIILCDLPKSHENAVQWAAKQTCKAPIRVVLEGQEQEHFKVLDQLLREFYEKMLKKRPMLVPLTPGLLAPGTKTVTHPSGTPTSGRSKVNAADVDCEELRRAIDSGFVVSL